MECSHALQPNQVAGPDNLDAALDRWSNASITGEGLFTQLSLGQEFRCYVAAMYPTGFANNKTVLFGDARSTDVARRCAFYAKGAMKTKDIEKYSEQDGAAFVFAVLLNWELLRRAESRAVLQQISETWGMEQLFEKRVSQCRNKMKKWFQA